MSESERKRTKMFETEGEIVHGWDGEKERECVRKWNKIYSKIGLKVISWVEGEKERKRQRERERERNKDKIYSQRQREGRETEREGEE